MKHIIFSLLVLALSNITFAQGNAVTPRFATVMLQDGVPELVPGRRMKFDLASPRFALLEDKAGSHTLYFLQGQRDERQTYWTVLLRSDSTLTLSSLSMTRSSDGILIDSTELDLDPTTSARAPIEIRLLPANGLVMYRWLSTGYAQTGAGGVPVEQPVGRIEEGSLAPNFEVRMLAGETLRLSDLAGSNIVVNWWATTCAPCLAEMPGLNELAHELGSRDDLVFLAIAYDTESDLRAFLKERTFLYQQGLGDERLLNIFGAGFPRNVVISSSGHIIYDQLGANESQHREIRAVLEQHGLLDE